MTMLFSEQLVIHSKNELKGKLNQKASLLSSTVQKKHRDIQD